MRREEERRIEERTSWKTETYVMSRTEMTPCLSKHLARYAKAGDNGETECMNSESCI